MVSSSMVVQDQTNGVLLDTSTQSVAGEGHVPKIRKPYTITKQRERWTEEEHQKFLEALKLYGRVWRKIEEHVGTKTTVQIRSHAQKFFSKVVCETSNSNSNTIEPIVIPPPRPKRKPMHPYPRKLVLPVGKESCLMEQQERSTSPHSSLSEQENQSPTSVLSGFVSDTQVSDDMAIPNDSPSPRSCTDVDNEAGSFSCEDDPSQDVGHVPQPVPNDPVSVKLELFPTINAFDKEDQVATKVLKLFGKDVVVPNKSSDSSNRDIATENSFDGSVWYMDGSTNHVEKPSPLPWWVFFRGMSSPFSSCHHEEFQDKETQREGSSTGSSTGLVNGETNVDKNWDAESESSRCAPQSDKDNRSSIDNGMKGFVPYKRCVSERYAVIDDREGQRIRLFL